MLNFAFNEDFNEIFGARSLTFRMQQNKLLGGHYYLA